MRASSKTSRRLSCAARLLAAAAPLLAACSSGIRETGVVRDYEITASYGDYGLRMAGGMEMATVHGYLLDGQFLGPTLVANVGDTLRVTLQNETQEVMGLHPHGVRYDEDNEGVRVVAEAGGSVSYEWLATWGSGTFLYHSHEVDDEQREYQGLAGVLGVIEIRDPAEHRRLDPDFSLNYVMMGTYEPWTEPVPGAMGDDDDSASGDGEGAANEAHTHTMVVQRTDGEAGADSTDTLESLSAVVARGETVRVNVVGFGEEFHTFHSHGLAWNDLQTGETVDTLLVGPGTSTHFYWEKVDNPGLWMVHCHVDSHLHMMTTYLLVEE
jgi:FtsP/CotA-like multicopper oxidase with cupredoxin domain